MTVVTPVTAPDMTDEDGAGGKMPLLDHLIELRSRMIQPQLIQRVRPARWCLLARRVLAAARGCRHRSDYRQPQGTEPERSTHGVQRLSAPGRRVHGQPVGRLLACFH